MYQGLCRLAKVTKTPKESKTRKNLLLTNSRNCMPAVERSTGIYNAGCYVAQVTSYIKKKAEANASGNSFTTRDGRDKNERRRCKATIARVHRQLVMKAASDGCAAHLYLGGHQQPVSIAALQPRYSFASEKVERHVLLWYCSVFPS